MTVDSHPTSDLKRTPLYHEHVKLGGKMVPFAGWEMPVQYSGVIAEHLAVRESVGIFDVSHMGELWVTGPDALAALNWVTCNNISTLTDGRAQYNALTTPSGGVVDDIIVYRFSPERYFVCVNASNADKDFAWILDHTSHFDVKVENVSGSWGQIALQGPHAERVIDALQGGFHEAATLRGFHFAQINHHGQELICARTGYSGEDGFEIFVPTAHTSSLWREILETSPEVVPAGLGARDSLRLEACYPLHGHELSEEITAIESGLGWIVKPDKGDFIGRDVLTQQKAEGAPRGLVAFVVHDPGIARHGDVVHDSAGKPIGIVTSGTKTPTLQRSVGMALIESEYCKPETQLLFAVRGRQLKGQVVKKPLYVRGNK